MITLRYTSTRIVLPSGDVKQFIDTSEPSLTRDTLAAIIDPSMEFTAYGDHIIIKSLVYLYDNVRHVIVELAEKE